MSAYLSLDGPDGSGKSTQAGLLVDWLRQHGHEVLHLREPGSTGIGEQLRGILLDPGTGELEPLTEGLLFSAARREMLVRQVRPALAAGATVVAERCFLSTIVYQSLAPADGEPRMALELARSLSVAVHEALLPDAIFVLDVDPDTGAARVHRGGAPDRIEGRDAAFRRRVRDAFVGLSTDAWLRARLAQGRPDRGDRVRLVDAGADVDSVQQVLRAAAISFFGPEVRRS